MKVWRKGLIVTAAPDIIYAEDTDGDGRADVREILFHGFGEGNQQHRVNGLSFGLDNWLYCANGDSGGQIESKKTGDKVPISFRDFRFQPDDGRLELLLGQSQFTRVRDDAGNWFGSTNSEPMYQFVLEDRYCAAITRSRRRTGVSTFVRAGAAPVFPLSRTMPRFNDLNVVNRFTSACSAIVYRDDLFGPASKGTSYVSEPVHNLVHREVMSRDGVRFVSRRATDEQQSEFLASSDNWFRPTMLRTGPDGALWVADMYRAVIEHPEYIPVEWQKRLNLRAGDDMGRIYRVYPVGQPPRKFTRLERLDTAGLVAALDSPNGWQRDMAAADARMERRQVGCAAFEKNGFRGCVKSTCQRRIASDAHALGRLHALCTLDGLGGIDQETLLAAVERSRRHRAASCHTPGRKLARAIREARRRGAPADQGRNALVRLQLALQPGRVVRPARRGARRDGGR